MTKTTAPPPPPPAESESALTMRTHLRQQKTVLNALGFGGLIPFYALAAATAWGDAATKGLAQSLLAIYAATIVSFIGGIAWAMALLTRPEAPHLTRNLLVWSVIPPLMAAACFFAPLPARLWLLVMVLALAWIADKRFARALGLPSEWIQLRAALSLLAIGAVSWAASNVQ